MLEFLYKNFLKKVLFLIDPETVHDFFIYFGNLLGKNKITRELTKSLLYYKDKSLKQTIHGITFENPVGLAAGFDKDANLLQILPSVGFGFTEVGTVTFEAYEGNPKPRLKRFPEDKSLAVYYGLKNIGARKIIRKLRKSKITFPYSVSIGKTNCARTNTLDAGVKDYIDCLKLFEQANLNDFYTINISCPNTFGGEPFTDEKSLELLFSQMKRLKIKKPIFVKMPINLEWREFKKLIDTLIKYKVSGVIIGNLNKTKKYPNTNGGISGKATWRLSNELISKTYLKYGNKLTIIGVGGIFNAQDAYEKIKRGSSLVQLITGMIFEGPQLIGKINKELAILLKEDGYKNISEAVGAYYKN